MLFHRFTPSRRIVHDSKKRRPSFFKLNTWTLILIGTLTGWQPFSQIAKAQDTGLDDLKIAIIAGDGFTNNIKKRTAREEIVEVRDRNNKPVASALGYLHASQ